MYLFYNKASQLILVHFSYISASVVIISIVFFVHWMDSKYPQVVGSVGENEEQLRSHCVGSVSSTQPVEAESTGSVYLIIYSAKSLVKLLLN